MDTDTHELNPEGHEENEEKKRKNNLKTGFLDRINGIYRTLKA